MERPFRTIIMRGVSEGFCDYCNADTTIYYYSYESGKDVHALCIECLAKKWRE